MAFSLGRADVRERKYTLVVKNAEGQATTLFGSVKAALVPKGETPDANTAWVLVDFADNVVVVLLAGPEAPSDEQWDLMIPLEGADLYLHFDDETELEDKFAESLSVR
jgi:hypothetical protein